MSDPIKEDPRKPKEGAKVVTTPKRGKKVTSNKVADPIKEDPRKPRP